MSLSINNNITSLNAWRNLKQTDFRMSKTMEKLSSGLRINRAADDPAGLVISEKMRAQLVGLDAAAKNAEKAINMVQTAEAALDQVQKLLDKMRQLTVDTLNLGVNDDAMRKANQDELDEAIQSVTRIASYTQFGTKKLLDGSLGNTTTVYATDKIDSVTFGGSNVVASMDGTFAVKLDQIAQQAVKSFTISTDLASVSTSGGLLANATFTLNGVTITGSAGKNIASVINAYKASTGVSATVSSGKLILKTTAYGDDATITLLAASGELDTANVSATDTGQDAKATVSFANGSTLAFSNTSYNDGLTVSDGNGNVITFGSWATYASNSGDTISVAGNLEANNVRFQVGANATQFVSITIGSVKASKLGTGVTNDSGYTSLSDLQTNSVLKNGSSDNIEDALKIIDKAIDQVSDLRGKLGAVQADNLQVQLDRIRIAYENLQASESTIRDTDMTLEMAQFTKYQIMMQAGTAMLAQANQIPNNILQLLR
ncbi:flagellin N-terminal helical domain-containing protein [Deferrisoma camini]|uniref:flagellin N-terminal helical domain-containing protein n=1 Tax=Deferrisoma camini TaxID=1035120 RepID=UPI00046D5E52|nr:flagellin [Deferrisoma camini]